jgi:hypothetical protein
MTHLCCLRCSLRFASRATLTACPECSMPLEGTGDSAGLLGFKFFGVPAAEPLSDAVVVSLSAFHLKHTRGG